MSENRVYEITRYDGSVLFSLECGSLRICIEAAVKAGACLGDAYLAGANLVGANLGDAYLRGADLVGANLRGANLEDTDLIDAGQDRRGFRFWAWRDNSGVVVYRGGCHTWTSIDDAIAWYGDSYSSNGDRAECIARLTLLRDEAARRWQA